MIDRHLNYGRHLIRKFALGAKPYSTVLDLGAGHGDDLLIAKSIVPSARLMAIENYEPYAQELRGQGIEVFASNLEQDPLPFENESVDMVISNQILEHCKEIWWIFHEVSRILKRGGKFVIGVPNLASVHNRILLAVGEQPTSIKNNTAHVRGYTKKDMLKFAETGFPAGYVLKDFGGSNFYPFPGFVAKPLAKMFPTGAWGIFFMLEKTRAYQGDFIRYPVENRIETNFFVGKK